MAYYFKQNLISLYIFNIIYCYYTTDGLLIASYKNAPQPNRKPISIKSIVSAGSAALQALDITYLQFIQAASSAWGYGYPA